MTSIVKMVVPALAGMVFLYTPFLWCRLRHECPAAYGLEWRFDRKKLIEALAVTFVFLIPLTVVSILWPWEQLPRYSPLWRTLNLLAAGLAAAIIEEVFFRGWIQPLFRKKLSAFWSIAFTGAVFAASHVFVARLPFLFAVFVPGCVMGYLRERHGDISTSTLFHFLGNIWAIWFAPLVWPTLSEVRHLLEVFL